MENTVGETRLGPRNVFVKASASDMGKETSNNLKQAFLVMNVYNGRLKNYPIEEAGFSYSMNVSRAGDDNYGDEMRDVRRTNVYVRKALNQMGLQEAAKNYLLGDKDNNSAEDNRILESVLNKAIGMINPYKVPAKSDGEIRSELSELNQDYAQQTSGLVKQLKDGRIFERIMGLNNPKPSLIGHIRRAFT